MELTMLNGIATAPASTSLWRDTYPAHLAQTWTLGAGGLLIVRPVRHDDDERELAFVCALSPASRYQRMLSGGIKATPEWIRSMTHIDYRRHMAFAITNAIEGVEQFVGVGRYVVDASEPTADVALVLADAWQGMGLGRRLLQMLLAHAATAGVREAIAAVLATNVAMLRLARSLGFAVSAEPGDATLRRINRRLDAAITRQH